VIAAKKQRSCEAGRTVEGITLLEVLVVIAVIGIVFTILMPRFTCMIAKGHTAEAVQDLRQARDLIETFETELGVFPSSLQEVYRDRPVPDTLVYCIDDVDHNKGHGNETCMFLDWDNPSGKNQHGGFEGIGYLLRTHENLSPCQNIDFIFTSCCGGEPHVVKIGEMKSPPGHPGNPGGKGGGGKAK
jgi:type II secretory pathway pseudopilin PulG